MESKITTTILSSVSNFILSRRVDKIRRPKIIIAINVCGLTIALVVYPFKGGNC
ncbi:hypothetical protein VDIAB_220041 [Vibrio diabolicus]|nr:hypothetical protein VDIAB_220041 [Vibrio diabolicus]